MQAGVGESVLILDGNAMAYRAFYGIRSELASSDGTPTNALFGVSRMVSQLVEAFFPKWIIAVFDYGLPSARMEILPEYKQQRKPMPDALRTQMPLIREFLTLYGLPVVRVESQEADDVMAVIADRMRPLSQHIYVVSNDKDMFQLVDDTVSIVHLGNGMHTVYDREAVCQKTGVFPEQIIDWLTLIGDSADNIPGVKGIGVKTATKLLNTHGSIQAMYDDLDLVKPVRYQESLRQSTAIIERNKLLVTLNREIELSDDSFMNTWSSGMGSDAMADFCQRYGLKSFIKREIAVQQTLF